MKISTLLKIILRIFLVVFSLSIFFIVLLYIAVKSERDARERQTAYIELSRVICETSDYLTRESRAYVQFGEITHYTNYWREVNEVKSREYVITKLIAMGIPQDELNLVTKAKDLSVELQDIEYAAMNAYDIGDFVIAREMLFNNNYKNIKKEITDTMDEFQVTIQDRINTETGKVISRTTILLMVVSFAILTMAMAVIISILLIKGKLKPIDKLVEVSNEIADGNLDVSLWRGSEDEIGMIFNSFSRMVTKFQTYIDDLTIEKERAEEAARSKSIFLANMSHEIRTPLNAIKGLSDLLFTTSLEDVQKNYVRNIIASSASLIDIINNILDFSKIDANKFEIDCIEYDLVSLLSDIANLINLKASEKELMFISDIDPTLPALLVGDDIRIKQVLVNILNNAVKFTQNGYVKLTVKKLISDQNECSMLFTIEDSGAGIKESDLENLFEPFGRYDLHKNRDVQGTGLGLPISRSIVNMMGGDIIVESEYGKGSKFKFVISQKIACLEEIAVVSDKEEKSVLMFGRANQKDFYVHMLDQLSVENIYCSNEEEFLEAIANKDYNYVIYWYEIAHDIISFNREKLNNSYVVTVKELNKATNQITGKDVAVLFEPILISAIANVLNRESYDIEDEAVTREENIRLGEFKTKGARLLIVDDNEVNLMVAAEILRQYDIEPDVANGGYKALNMLKSNEYDLIFMDHMMPEMDGIEVTQKLRKLDRYSSIPVVALTANAVSGVSAMFIENGLQDYISKPIDILELNRVLRQWLPKEKILDSIDTEEVKKDNGHKSEIDKLNGIEDLIVTEAISAIGGSETAYLSILNVFINTIPDKIKQIENYVLNQDIDSAKIEYHGLKSALFNIGSHKISASARSLEMACARNDIEYIQENFEKFTAEIEWLYNKLMDVVAFNNEGKTHNDSDTNVFIDDDEFLEKLLKIEENLNELNEDEAVKILEELMNSNQKEQYHELLNHIQKNIQVFDYDQISEDIHSIMKV